MIDTNSINSFVATMPEAPIEIEEIFLFRMRLPEAISPATASLAQRGYLGCLPFAHQEADEFVLRFLPGRNITNSPVAVAWWTATEGFTIAPDLKRFLAGFMAYTDIAAREISEDAKNKMLNFSSEFGDISSTTAVLTTVDEAKVIQDARDRKAILWAAGGANNPMCRTISAAWQLDKKDAGDWAERAIHDNPEVDIPWRVYFYYNSIYKTGIDLTEAAWRLIVSDDVFDTTYTGYNRGNRKGMWEGRPLLRAVKWLQEQENIELKTHPSLWEAVQAFAEDPENYNGSEHLTAAQEIAFENPELAYTCAANAAAYYAHATERTPRSAIVFAHELAVANGWQELEILLSWTRNEMNI
jgi:hypothetical protein